MSELQKTSAADHVDTRAQRELTERVGTRLVRQSKAHNLKWSTWKSRSGIGGGRERVTA
jgi:hypothetical protein